MNRHGRRDAEWEAHWGRMDIVVHKHLTATYPTVHDPTQFIKETIRSTKSWRCDQDNEWVKPRRDTALFRYDRQKDDGTTMGNRRVGQVLLLSNVQESWGSKDLSLVYVECFRTVKADALTGMYQVKRMSEYEVVEVDIIERGAHLIPCFTGVDTPMARSSQPALDLYAEFWLNNQIDPHMYNAWS